MQKETGEPPSNKKIEIDHVLIKKQLLDLTELSTVKRSVRQSDNKTFNKTSLFWAHEPSANQAPAAKSLGLYSKWLILLDMVFEAYGSDFDLTSLTEAPKNQVRQSRNDGLRKLFYEKSASQWNNPANYDPTDTLKTQEDRDLRVILTKILDRFNEYQEERGHKTAITTTAFVKFEASLQPGALTVGSQPIKRFKHWLTYQQVLPNPPCAAPFNTSNLSGEFASLAQAFVHKVIGPDSPACHQKIITNYFGRMDDKTLSEFSATLKAAISEAADGSDASYLPAISVSLKAGVSRLQALNSLGRQMSETFVEIKGRDVDLAIDLKEIREQLTIGKIVVIFEAWDNTEGPFGSLRNFLCDTHWGEFIRCLVQPVQAQLMADKNSSQMHGRIVVLSSGPANELLPWTLVQTPVSSGAAIPSDTHDKLSALIRRAFERSYVLDQPSVGKYGENPILEFKSVALQFIAASVSGIELSALKRCLQQWVMLFEWRPSSSGQSGHLQLSTGETLRLLEERYRFEQLIDGLLKEYGQLICLVDHAQNERQASSSSLPEFSSGLPSVTKQDQGPSLYYWPMVGSLDLEAPQTAERTIQFKSRWLNTCFVSIWNEIKAFEGAPSSTAAKNVGTWQHVNFVLAEEALRQATAQASHLPYSVRENASSFRWFLQTIYHSLACYALDVSSPVEKAQARQNLHTTALPSEPSRRYRYIYVFLYRRCVESGTWRLSRSFGRSDLRLDLLTIFLIPLKAHLLLSGFPESLQQRLLPELYHPEKPLPLRDPELRCELLEALGRAGLDTSIDRGREAAKWALSILPGWRLYSLQEDGPDKALPAESHAINSRLPDKDRGYYKLENAALKLHLDWRLSSGKKEDLPRVIHLCKEQLQRMGISLVFLENLPKDVAAVIQKMQSNDGVINDVLKRLGEALGILTSKEQSVPACVVIADTLYRLADAYATQADIQDFRGNRHKQQPGTQAETQEMPQHVMAQYATACAVYWLADWARAKAGSQNSSGVSWPTVGSRGTRYYVRVCMVLARMILEDKLPKEGRHANDLGFALLDLAGNRLSLLVRHHYMLDRERAGALLLQSARIRSWVRVKTNQGYLRYQKKIFVLLKSRKEACLEKEHAALELNGTNSKNHPEKLKNVSFIEKQKIKEERRDLENKVEIKQWKVDNITKQLVGQTKDFLRHIHQQHQELLRAQAYLSEVENLLLALGFQPAHTWRLHLEKIKYTTTLAKILLVTEKNTQVMMENRDKLPEWEKHRKSLVMVFAEKAHEFQLQSYLRVAQLTLLTLESTTIGNRFWSVIHDRQQASLALVEEKTALLLRSVDLKTTEKKSPDETFTPKNQDDTYGWGLI